VPTPILFVAGEIIEVVLLAELAGDPSGRGVQFSELWKAVETNGDLRL
jgi:hypothetical protein